jgi:hypothetical protein
MPTTIQTNLADFLRAMADLPNAANLNRGELADRLFNELAPRIAARFAAQRGARSRFQKNRGRYGTAKRERGIPVGIGMGRRGKRGGDMARLANFLGRRTVKEDEATLAFGITNLDRRKGMWFENGSSGGDGDTEKSGAVNQPERPYWEMNESDISRFLDVIADRFVEHFQGL